MRKMEVSRRRSVYEDEDGDSGRSIELDIGAEGCQRGGSSGEEDHEARDDDDEKGSEVGLRWL